MRASGQVDRSITCDPDNVGASSVEVVFPLAGLSSHVADFDEHLRSACFFDTGNFPHTTFKSTSVRRQASTRLPRSSASTSTWACSCRTSATMCSCASPTQHRCRGRTTDIQQLERALGRERECQYV